MVNIQQQKRGTADRWSSLDPILADGEIGYETDTVKFKIGDGINRWSSLSYFSTTGGGGGSGTVTSVGMTVPTGLSVTPSTITTSGTFAVSLASGYSIPDTTTQGYWTTAYNERAQWDGGSTGLTPATGRTSLGATTVGSNIFTLTNPSAVTFLRINADNTVTARSAANFRSDIGAGTGSGTVTDLSIVSANGFSGTVATSTTTPAITLTTSITGLLSGNGTAISAASIGYGDTTNPYSSKTTNYVLAGPAGGPSASPAFRALVSADIPDLSGTYASLGAATNTFTGDIAVNGGDITSTSATLAIAMGTPIATSPGRAITITAGGTTNTNGTGGSLTLTGGSATTGTSTASGGDIFITGGASNTTGGVGGDVTINGGLGSGPLSNGNGTISIGTSNTDSLTIGNASANISITGITTFASAVNLRAGGTGANTAPLYFGASSSVLSTPVAGAIEYNNANFLATPFTTSGRALIESNYFYSNQSSITVAGTSTGGAAISGSAFGVALPLATSTAYQIEATLYLQTSYSTNAPASETMTFSYPTGTTILAEGNIIQNVAAVTTISTASSFYAMQQNTNRTLTAVTVSGNWHRITMRGIIRTSTTAGSFSINFGGTNGATPATLTLTLGADSFIKLTPIGSATSSNSFGAWA
jgi:hypothetical protein